MANDYKEILKHIKSRAVSEKEFQALINLAPEDLDTLGELADALNHLPIERNVENNSVVQRDTNVTAFGDNATALGTSSTNAIDRGITEESTPEEIVTEWQSSNPESDKFSLVKGEGAYGEGNNGLSLGKNSHVEGNGCIAYDNFSHAEGEDTQANAECSHTEGRQTRTSNDCEHAEGKYNKSNTNTISSVGIGTSNSDRKNAFEIMQNGNAYLYGIGGYNGTNPAVATPINQMIGQGGGSSALIVEGTMVEVSGSSGHYRFTPDDGQPSWDDAQGAFMSGRGVILCVADDEAEYFSVYRVNTVGSMYAGDGNMIVSWPESE